MATKTHYEKYEERYSYLDKGLQPTLEKSTNSLEIVKELSTAGADAWTICRAIDLLIRRPIRENTTIEELASTEEVQSLAVLLRAMTSEAFKDNVDGEIASLVYRNWHQKKHEMEGKRVYVVSHGLAARLLSTELRGLKGSDIQLPFRSIYIQIPDGLGLRIQHWASGFHDVEGAYISEFDSDKGRAWSFLLCGKGNEIGQKVMGSYDDAVYSYNVYLPDDRPLDLILEDIFIGDDYSEQARKQARKDSEEILNSFKFLLNVIMYSTCSEMRYEIASSRERRKLQEKLNKLPKSSKHKKKRGEILAKIRKTPEYHRIVLGPHLKPWTKGDTHEKDGVTPRVLVQGHHRNQACGTGRRDRKRIWIQPHWRGTFEQECPKKERRELV